MTKTYNIVIEDDGKLKIADENGSDVAWITGHSLLREIKHVYGMKSYIYIAESYDDYDLYKIGVTNNIMRRQRELDVFMRHWIRCAAEDVFALEKELHLYFDTLRVAGEWFRLDSDDTYDFLAMLDEIKTDRDLRSWLYVARRAQPGSWWRGVYEAAEKKSDPLSQMAVTCAARNGLSDTKLLRRKAG